MSDAPVDPSVRVAGGGALVAAPFAFVALEPILGAGATVLAALLVAFGIAAMFTKSPWATGLVAHFSRRRWRVNATLALLSAVVTLGAVELGVRGMVALGWLETYAPMRTLLPAGTADWRFAHITADRHREPDPVLLWQPAARAPYNTQRMKGPIATVPKPESALRVMAYGDSNTDGPNAGGWTEHLASALESRLGGPAEVLNAGVAGYSSHQGLLRFQADVTRYTPDVVLVSFGWNDVATPSARADKDYRPPAPWRIALERVAIRYQTILAFRRALLERAPPGEEWAAEGPAHRVSADDYEINLRRFAEIGRSHGARVVLLTRPYRLPTETLLASDGWRREVPRYNQRLLDLAERENIAAIDVEAAFADADDLFVDECHFTPEGHQAMATLVADALVTNVLVDR